MKSRPRLTVLALLAGIAAAQPAHVLDIEIENGIVYIYDTTELAKYATAPGLVAPWSVSSAGPARNFWSLVYIADIVSVNGRPARGVMVRRGTRIGLTPNQAAGQAIADTTRGFIDDGVWEIQTADGTAVGTFHHSRIHRRSSAARFTARSIGYEPCCHRRNGRVLWSARPNGRRSSDRQFGAAWSRVHY